MGNAQRKYSTLVGATFLNTYFPGKFPGNLDLLSASLSSSTWRRVEAAYKSWLSFSSSNKTSSAWPAKSDSLANFVNWAARKEGLKAATISVYLSSLKSLHRLLGLSVSDFDSLRVKSTVKGAENLEIYSTHTRASRKVMSLPILMLLGHEIRSSAWSENSKRVFWAACCTAFYGSFRLGELLASREFSFSPDDTLLWKDAKILQKDHVLLHIKSSTCGKKGGDFVDLFSVPFPGTCPVSALLGL